MNWIKYGWLSVFLIAANATMATGNDKIAPADKIILWEVHRGGGNKMPESSLAAFEYGWMIGGVPEADVNVTKDMVIISLHDPNLSRVSNAPPEIAHIPVKDLTFEEIQKWNIGNSVVPEQRVPALKDVFKRLQQFPERQMILDFKNAPLDKLSELIYEYKVASQLTFATSNVNTALKIKELVPEIKVKLWIGGSAESIMKSFESLEAHDFYGFEQVQLHLNDRAERVKGQWRYQLSPEQITLALQKTQAKQVLLQVLPWNFDREDLFMILDLGVRSFAVDYVDLFCYGTSEYFAAQSVSLE